MGKTYQNDQINKQTEQMFILLAICLVIHPKRIDESLHATLKEKSYAEKINKMQAGERGGMQAKDARNLQLRVFLDEVQQQMLLPVVRSYLKLYTSMPIDKLASYMNTTVDDLESNLLCFKQDDEPS